MSHYQNSNISPEQLPTVNNAAFIGLEKAYLKVGLISLVLNFGFLAGIFLVISVSVEQLPFGQAIWLVWFTLLIVSVIYHRIAFANKGYAIREKDLLYKQGLIWQQVTGVSYKRIQHVGISHGPIERMFDLANINIYTAGGAGVDLKIAGLTQARAEQIKEFILSQTGIHHEQ
ncbi:PH domain-containing protein [Aliikangiella maris]|uniref:PH domain-containing protein n=2 Tax=Aliikangiella maris TaxID=3162458 RepID=A0ABV3MIC3_9GAMM